MKKQVSHEDYTRYSGESDLALAGVLELFDDMNWIDGSFMGFPINETYFFQIMCGKNGFFTAEFLDDGDIYQKQASKPECRAMVKNFFEKQSMEPEMMNGFEGEKQPQLLYDSVKDSWWKKALVWIIFVGFFIGLLVLGAYMIYW